MKLISTAISQYLKTLGKSFKSSTASSLLTELVRHCVNYFNHYTHRLFHFLSVFEIFYINTSDRTVSVYWR